MAFALTSHMGLKSALRQYYIDTDAPVTLSLHGSESYCNLEGIQNSELKETLSKVGDLFESREDVSFYKVTHTFTPVEVSESKSSGSREDQNYVSEVQDIFAFVKTAVSRQTDHKLMLDLTDLDRLVVEKVVGRRFFWEPHRMYQLQIMISEETVDAAKKLGLVFRKYGYSLQSDTRA